MRRRRLLSISLVIVLGGFATAFAIAQWETVRAIAHGLGSIDPAVAGLGVAGSLLAMTNRGMLNRAAHGAVGLSTGVGAMTHTAAVGFAAQKLVRSGGAIGLAVFVRHGRRRGHTPADVVAACVLTAAASFGALGVLLVAAIGVLAATDQLSGWWLAAAGGFAIYALLVVAGVAVVMRSRRATEALWRFGQRAKRRLPWVRRTEETPLPTELFRAISMARHRPLALARMMAHAVASKALGALMLTAAVSAAGVQVGVADAIVVYATALAASMVSIVPGGVGAVEGSTAALLVASGASAGAAALAVALFRLFDLWLPVLTGAAVARGELGARPANAG